MNIVLTANVNHNGRQFESGDELNGINDVDGQALVDSGVAEVIEEKKTKRNRTVNLDEDKANKSSKPSDDDSDEDEESDEDSDEQEVPTLSDLKRMNKTALQNTAKDLELEFDPEATNKQLVELIDGSRE